MQFDYSVTQKFPKVFPKVPHKTNIVRLIQFTLGKLFLGQRIVKMHLFPSRKIMVGSENIFLILILIFLFLSPKMCVSGWVYVICLDEFFF